jgi:hypothetical protein
MDSLINNIKAFLEADISSGSIDATIVIKGLDENPQDMAKNLYPYIALDDGGERVEEVDSDTAQLRVYSVIFEIGVYQAGGDARANTLDDILSISGQVKTSVEAEANRQKDSHIWGKNIVPFAFEAKGGFFRGRTITVDYTELEDRYLNY